MEKETFLPKDQPREKVWVTEYTVIPLDELPEKHLSGWGLESDPTWTATCHKGLLSLYTSALPNASFTTFSDTAPFILTLKADIVSTNAINLKPVKGIGKNVLFIFTL